MIKIIAKKDTLKARMKGAPDTVGAEIVHASVKLVEHLIEIDKETGYATGATIIEILQKMIPERKRKSEAGEEVKE